MASGRDLAEVHAGAFEGTDLAAVCSHPDGRLVDVNENFLGITGCDRDEFIGHVEDELRLWVDPDQRERIPVDRGGA
jgi:PAS domain-containing protein